MMIEENPVMMIEENASLYREHHLTRDIEGEGAFLSEIQEGDDLRHHTFFNFFCDRNCCTFINNWFDNIYNNESDQSISKKGSIIVNWLCVITIIYLIVSSVLVDRSPLVIIFQIIISCLVIGSLQFTDMFGKRLDNNTIKGLHNINTRMEGIETRMNTRWKGLKLE